jgi:hypothetical protein
MNISTYYLFERHSESELRDWASRLNYFRYFRAYGGHANDGDSLDVAISYTSTESLLELFKLLRFEPTIFREKPPQPISGVSYSWEEYSNFPSLITGTEWIQQPGHCELFRVKVFFWCESGVAKISSSPASYDVNITHVISAEKLENEFKKLNLDYIDPPNDTDHYICPKYYPDFFIKNNRTF